MIEIVLIVVGIGAFLLILCGIALVGGIVGVSFLGTIKAYIVQMTKHKKADNMDIRMTQIENSLKGSKSSAARQLREEEENAAIGELMLHVKNKKPIDLEFLTTLGAKYPTLGKRFLKAAEESGKENIADLAEEAGEWLV